MLTLVRKDDRVFYNDVELTINAQASKGPNNEVVKIAGLPNSNGQKWVSLSRLEQGQNQIACKARVVKTQKYTLTDAEAAEIKKHQDAIDKIIATATERYVPIPNIDVDVKSMTKEQKLELASQLEKYLGLTK